MTPPGLRKSHDIHTLENKMSENSAAAPAKATKAAPKKRAAAKPEAKPVVIVETVPVIVAEPSVPEAPATEMPAEVFPVKAARTVKPPKATKAPKMPKAPKAAKVEKPAKIEKEEKPAKAEKPPKLKLVRDSFTMPEADYAHLALLKKRCLEAGVAVKKSEILRLGLQVLAQLPSADLAARIEALEKLKTGRPAKL